MDFENKFMSICHCCSCCCVVALMKYGPAEYKNVVKRMEGVDKDKQKEEGIKICVETIQKLKEMDGVKGVHIMAIEWEEAVGEIAEKAGLLPRP